MDISVPTTPPQNRFCIFIERAITYSSSSPSTISPSESTIITRSPSPSSAIPTSALNSKTFSRRSSGCVDPQFLLIFEPSGSTEIPMTSASSSRYTRGATSYAAPFAQSTTTFRPSSRTRESTVPLQNSIYRPCASSTRKTWPKFDALIGESGALSCLSIDSSIASLSLFASLSKNLSPLSSKALWEALMTIPRSPRIVRVMYATAGVGIGPSSATSAPADDNPASNADSSM